MPHCRPPTHASFVRFPAFTQAVIQDRSTPQVMPSVLAYCLLAPVLYLGVQFVRKLVVPGPFDHIAGPKPASRILGEHLSPYAQRMSETCPNKVTCHSSLTGKDGNSSENSARTMDVSLNYRCHLECVTCICLSLIYGTQLRLAGKMALCL